jgi:2-dehydro-3-deoxygalactonokinase
MIGIDWGTSSLRAYRLGADGQVREKRDSADGILTVPPGDFPDVLRRVAGDWMAEGEHRVLLCGMVGSRQGWVEAPYLPCPAGPAEIAAQLTRVPFEGAEVRLVPGLVTRDAGGVPDVMRGEETKLVGLLAEGVAGQVCLPGTHSKWVRLAGGRVVGFATHMTGEVRAVLLAHSILGKLVQPGESDAAFAPGAFTRGVTRSGEAGGLLHHAFGTRGLGLLGELAEAETASYLSGLLIGHEIRAALLPGELVHLAAADTLAAPYAAALRLLGAAVREHDPDIVVRGLVEIGRHWA